MLHNRPLIPGHEVVGTVVELGPGEKNWKLGDRVGGAWHGGHDGDDDIYNNELTVSNQEA